MSMRTKFQIPPLRDGKLVSRPHLHAALNEGEKRKLTFLAAPAGYGKTTLLLDWAHARQKPTAWLSLVETDNDFRTFWSSLFASIAYIVPELKARITSWASLLFPDRFEPALHVLLDELGNLGRPLTILVDDFHHIRGQEILSALSRFVGGLPCNVHLVLASREDSPFPVARLLATGDFERLSVAELRFSEADAACFFRECMELTLANGEVERLVRLSEGWVTGLQLAGLSLRKSGPEALARGLGGSHRNIASYLLEEVFVRQEAKLQAFMMRISVLHRISGDACLAVSGEADAFRLLDQMERSMLFLVPLDEEREWYRYHHLFADFLRSRLRRSDARAWEEAQIAAARWWEEKGDKGQAVGHWLAAGCAEEAACVIEKALDEVLRSGEEWSRSEASAWFRELPPTSYEDKPQLRFFRISLLAQAFDLRAAETELLRVRDRLPESNWQPWKGIYHLFFAEVSLYQRDLEKTWAHLAEYEREMPDGSDMLMIGANSVTGMEYESYMAFMNGREPAERFLRHWIEIWGRKPRYPFVGYLYLAYAELLYEADELPEAVRYAELTFRQNQMRPYARITVHGCIAAARAYWALGRTEEATKLLEEAEYGIRSPDSPLFVSKLRAERAFISIKQNRVAEAGKWLQASGLRTSDAVPLSRIREYFQVARTAAATGNPEGALELLRRMYHRLNEENRLRYKLKALVLISLVSHQSGDDREADACMEEALQIAESENYVRGIVDEGRPVAVLLEQYIHKRRNGAGMANDAVSVAYAMKLLSAIPDRGGPSNESPLTAREKAVLRYIQDGLSNKEIAAALKISAGTVKTHMKNLYRKMDVCSRVQAIRRGKEWGLI